MPSTIESIIWGVTANSRQVWDGFWEIAHYMNGNVQLNGDTDFGDARDNSPTSKNLKPHKIRWDVLGESTAVAGGGHDHSGLFLSGPVGEYGLKKKHFDLNSCRVLWTDLWGDEGDSDRYAIIGSVSYMNPGETELPGDAEDYVEITTEGCRTDLSAHASSLNAYDDSAGRWNSLNQQVLGYICGIEADTVTPGSNVGTETSVIVSMNENFDNAGPFGPGNPGTARHHIYVTQGSGNYNIHTLMFVKYRVAE